MKKMLILFFLIFLNANNVLASETTESIVEWTDVKNDELELIDTERRYKWYKEEIIESEEYYIEGLSSSNFPYKKEKDFIETSFSGWGDTAPENYNGRITEERVVNKYRELRPIRYIFFEEIKGGFTTFKVSEIKILINNIAIDYDIECFNCSPNFNIDIKNGVINEALAYVNNGGHFRIDLKDYYSIGKLKIELYMADTVPNTKQAKIYMNEGETLSSGNYAYKLFESFLISKSSTIPDKYLIIPSSNWIINPVYNDWVYIDGFLNTTYYRQMVTAVEYRYKDIKYKYYNIYKNYLDDYYKEIPVEGYIKDENNYKDYFQYQLVEKPPVTIPDVNDEEKIDEVVLEDSVDNSEEKQEEIIDQDTVPQINEVKKETTNEQSFSQEVVMEERINMDVEYDLEEEDTIYDIKTKESIKVEKDAIGKKDDYKKKTKFNYFVGIWIIIVVFIFFVRKKLKIIVG